MNGEPESLRSLPGFAHLSPALQRLLEADESDDRSSRTELLEKVAEAVEVFVAMGLLEFVYLGEPAEASRTEISLIDPDDRSTDPVAWFTMEEAGPDEFRDAVTIFGELSSVLNPPIVLDAADDDEE